MIVIKKLTIHSVIFVLASLALQSQAHQGSHSDAPIVACKEKKLTNQCEYSNHDGDIYRGTCRSFSDVLMCVRNKPIIKAKKAAITESAQEAIESGDVSSPHKALEKAAPEKAMDVLDKN